MSAPCCAAQAALLGDDEAEHDRCRLVVGQHQRRKSRAGPQPVAASDARLAVDRDAEVVQGDRIAPHGALGHAQLGGGGAPVDDGPALE